MYIRATAFLPGASRIHSPLRRSSAWAMSTPRMRRHSAVAAGRSRPRRCGCGTAWAPIALKRRASCLVRTNRANIDSALDEPSGEHEGLLERSATLKRRYEQKLHPSAYRARAGDGRPRRHVCAAARSLPPRQGQRSRESTDQPDRDRQLFGDEDHRDRRPHERCHQCVCEATTDQIVALDRFPPDGAKRPPGRCHQAPEQGQGERTVLGENLEVAVVHRRIVQHDGIVAHVVLALDAEPVWSDTDDRMIERHVPGGLPEDLTRGDVLVSSHRLLNQAFLDQRLEQKEGEGKYCRRPRLLRQYSRQRDASRDDRPEQYRAETDERPA